MVYLNLPTCTSDIRTNYMYLNIPYMDPMGYLIMHYLITWINTRFNPQKFNMEPENDGFQEELPFLGTSFQVPC